MSDITGILVLVVFLTIYFIGFFCLPILLVAMSAGAGAGETDQSKSYKKCPFCKEKGRCKHFAANIISRADLFRGVIRDITHKNLEFRDGKMDIKYGIVWVGTLEYAQNPAQAVKSILDFLLQRLGMIPGVTKEKRIEIQGIYKKCLSGEAFTYRFSGGDTWECGSDERMKEAYNLYDKVVKHE